MKKSIALLGITMAVGLLAFVTGCASVKETEDLLATAGFKKIPATTAGQQVHLKSLPNHKISQVQRNGNTYFVYPDVAHNVLYVGDAWQYHEYQKLVDEREEEAVDMDDTMPGSQAGWEVWGPWEGASFTP
jgi:hypothetical protein